jgi:hypothetical protein
VAAALTQAPTHAPPSLPTIDHDRLAELEAVVERGLRTFVEVGLALATIRDEQLYRATHSSFRAYLEQRWSVGQPWAYSRIYASRVALAISAEHGPLPAGVSPDALRALVPLLNREGPDAVAQAWGAVLDRHERHGAQRRPPSREQVRAALAERGLTDLRGRARTAPGHRPDRRLARAVTGPRRRGPGEAERPSPPAGGAATTHRMGDDGARARRRARRPRRRAPGRGTARGGRR